jgi:hypothetical protein
MQTPRMKGGAPDTASIGSTLRISITQSSGKAQRRAPPRHNNQDKAGPSSPAGPLPFMTFVNRIRHDPGTVPCEQPAMRKARAPMFY